VRDTIEGCQLLAQSRRRIPLLTQSGLITSCLVLEPRRRYRVKVPVALRESLCCCRQIANNINARSNLATVFMVKLTPPKRACLAKVEKRSQRVNICHCGDGPRRDQSDQFHRCASRATLGQVHACNGVQDGNARIASSLAFSLGHQIALRVCQFEIPSGYQHQSGRLPACQVSRAGVRNHGVGTCPAVTDCNFVDQGSSRFKT
jgi:hypothetical protein